MSIAQAMMACCVVFGGRPEVRGARFEAEIEAILSVIGLPVCHI
jgi:hypothetical protein